MEEDRDDDRRPGCETLRAGQGDDKLGWRGEAEGGDGVPTAGVACGVESLTRSRC